MNKLCFVIQPFDKGKFDKRYIENIKPAILQSGFDVYRVDEDDSSIIPIESIHNKIKSSDVCIAEISTDNPNVWYELGFAIACDKLVIMLCSDERNTPFPFDIRHRNILNYQTQCESDFNNLRVKLKDRLKSYKQNYKEYFIDENLSNYEKDVLSVVWKNQNTPYELTSKESIIKSDQNKNQVINAIRKLTEKKFIEFTYSNEEGIMKYYYRLTITGENWVKDNIV